MSQIIRKIEAKATGRYYYEDPILTVTYSEEPIKYKALTEYSIRVELGTRVQVTDESQELGLAMEVMKRSLTETIFGEFRPAIYKLYHQLYSRDFEGAKLTLQDIEQRMFYDHKEKN